MPQPESTTSTAATNVFEEPVTLTKINIPMEG
jgi:hypothetical protein